MKLKKMIFIGSACGIGYILGLAIAKAIALFVDLVYLNYAMGFILGLAIAFLIGFVCRYYILAKVSKG